jgi:hypothetical protein
MNRQLRRPTSQTRSNALQRRRLTLESLERRALLSASPLDGVTAQPMLHALTSPGGTPGGMSPAQIAQAYGFNQIQLSGGVKGDGSGQTIAIVDAYDDPTIASDLAKFDSQFGLAAPPSFTKVYQSGFKPQADSGWSQEISLDVEWAHAMAPKAKIVLVEANSANLGDLLSAVDTARNMPAVSVISMSWGSSEFYSETSYDSYFTTPAGHQGITFVASSGDQGAPGLWPSLSTNVLAVGGTSLHLSGGGYGSESAWSGSGGGTSQYENEPSYQSNVQSTGARSTPDVAYDANPSTGCAVSESYGSGGWMVVGGTSAGAPQWAALVAIADQGLAQAGKGTLDGAQSRVYQLPSGDFHDITSGSNGYSAGAGYDLVTGLGSPLANLVVSDLVAGTVSQPTPSGGSGNGGSGGGSGSGGSGGGLTGGSGSTGGGGSGGGYYYGGGFGGGFGGYGGGYYDPFGGYYGYGYSPWSWFFGGYGYNPFGGYSSGYGYNSFGGFSGGYSYNPFGGLFSGWGFGSSGRIGSLDVAAGGGGDAGTGVAVASASQSSADATAKTSDSATAAEASDSPLAQMPSTTVQVAASLPADHAASITDDLAIGEAETSAVDAYFTEADETD